MQSARALSPWCLARKYAEKARWTAFSDQAGRCVRWGYIVSRFVRLSDWFGVLAALLTCVALVPWVSSKAEAAVVCSFPGPFLGGYDAPTAQCSDSATPATAQLTKATQTPRVRRVILPASTASITGLPPCASIFISASQRAEADFSNLARQLQLLDCLAGNGRPHGTDGQHVGGVHHPRRELRRFRTRHVGHP
jgi:hypothetical protein